MTPREEILRAIQENGFVELKRAAAAKAFPDEFLREDTSQLNLDSEEARATLAEFADAPLPAIMNALIQERISHPNATAMSGREAALLHRKADYTKTRVPSDLVLKQWCADHHLFCIVNTGRAGYYLCPMDSPESPDPEPTPD